MAWGGMGWREQNPPGTEPTGGMPAPNQRDLYSGRLRASTAFNEDDDDDDEKDEDEDENESKNGTRTRTRTWSRMKTRMEMRMRMRTRMSMMMNMREGEIRRGGE